VNFGQIYLARPATTESDGTVNPLFPQEARLRNLTYSAPLYVDVKKTALTASGVDDPAEADWQPIKDEYGNEPDREEQKVWIGKVPIMTRSNFCLLNKLPEEDCYGIGECPLDSGGYFVVKGSEKVLIAQERMAANQVYTFKKQSPYTFFSTVTSHMEKGGKMPSETEVRMYPKASGSGTVSETL